MNYPDHKYALDLLLANACVQDTFDRVNGLGEREQGKLFVIDLHCATANIEAQLLSRENELDEPQYKLLSISIDN